MHYIIDIKHARRLELGMTPAAIFIHKNLFEFMRADGRVDINAMLTNMNEWRSTELTALCGRVHDFCALAKGAVVTWYSEGVGIIGATKFAAMPNLKDFSIREEPDASEAVLLPVTYVFTRRRIEDLVSNAEVSGMVRQWAQWFSTGVGRFDWELNDYQAEPEKSYQLTFKKCVEALKLMAVQHPRHFNDILKGNDDEVTADVFIQLATIGEVIYG